MSKERRALLRAYGAELISRRVPRACRRIATEETSQDDRGFIPQQFEIHQPGDPPCHHSEEIWNDTDGEVDMSSPDRHRGTITAWPGAEGAEAFREDVAVEPGLAVLSGGQKGLTRLQA